MIYIYIIYISITASNNTTDFCNNVVIKKPINSDSYEKTYSMLEYNILMCEEKANLINANNLDLYREPRFNGPNSPLIYRPTQEFIILCRSAGAEIPEVNHPNFYKVAIYLNNLKIEYPSFDEEILFEAALRVTNWNLIMK